MKYIEKTFIAPIQKNGPARSILVIGAGGFTLGLNDNKNNYTFIDINEKLDDLAEQHLLRQNLGDNKKYYTIPARGFLQQAINKEQTFDLVVVDTYTGKYIPEHLVTKEFFESTKKVLKNNGAVIFNILLSPNFNEQYSTNIDNTLRAAFPNNLSRQAVHTYNPWKQEGQNRRNIIYSYFKREDMEGSTIYTDNKNRVFYDTVKSINKNSVDQRRSVRGY